MFGWIVLGYGLAVLIVIIINMKKGLFGWEDENGFHTSRDDYNSKEEAEEAIKTNRDSHNSPDLKGKK